MRGKTNIGKKGWELRSTRGRRYNVRPTRKRFLIVTNGQTEAMYLDHYRGPSGPSIKVVFRAKDPLTLVQKAIDERSLRKRQGKSFDEVWVVLDRDANPSDSTDEKRFQRAVELAKRSKIEMACSDDAFELWYVLHYQDVQQSTDRNTLVQILEGHIGRKYKKGKESDLFHEILHLRNTAITRARAMKLDVNPSTRVYILVEKLLVNNE